MDSFEYLGAQNAVCIIPNLKPTKKIIRIFQNRAKYEFISH